MIAATKSGRTPEQTTEAVHERKIRQLSRLETVIDVLFALLIFQLVIALPQPPGDAESLQAGVISLLDEHLGEALMSVIGIILVLIYWQQSNVLFGNLARTDGRHSSLAILQMFCLLLYLYLTRMEIAFAEDPWSRVVAQGDRRPMADHPAAMEQLRAILDEREAVYSRARITVETSWRVPEEIVTTIAGSLRELPA